MTNAMNKMISNKELYLHCKQNAKSSVERFSFENIGNQWLQLFNELK
jgi:glycosyltransferase involved in cell wall biosynthesis